MRHTLPALACLAAVTLAAAAHAQAPAAGPAATATREATPQDARNQRIENIEVQDSGAKVNELRVGGETKSITVQPKAPLPAYTVQPAGAAGNLRESGPGAAGQRTWKVLDF